MVKLMHAKLLPGEFKALGYFVDEYFAAPTRLAKYTILVKNIWPCIQKLPRFREWEKRASAQKRRLSQLQVELQKENKNAFESLKEKIARTDGLDDLLVKQHIVEIAKKIEIRNYACNTTRMIRSLIDHLVDRDKLDMAKDYAKIGYVLDPENRVNQYWGEKPAVELYTFDPSFAELDTLESGIFGFKFEEICSVLDFFKNAYCGWHTSFDKIEAAFLKQGKLDSSSHKYHILNGDNILNHGYMKEMDTIKANSHEQTVYFSVENADKCLKFIVDEIMLQESMTKPVGMIKPFTLSHKLIDVCFLLDIETEGEKITRLLKEYKGQNGECYKIAEKVCNLNKCENLNLGTTTSDFMNDSGLNNVMGYLFFPKNGRMTNELWLWYKIVHINIGNEGQSLSNPLENFVTLSDEKLRSIIKIIDRLPLY